MALLRRALCCAFLAIVPGLLTGCQNVPTFGKMMHELSPHRLQRWNRHTPPSSGAYFSVADPIPFDDSSD